MPTIRSAIITTISNVCKNTSKFDSSSSFKNAIYPEMVGKTFQGSNFMTRIFHKIFPKRIITMHKNGDLCAGVNKKFRNISKLESTGKNTPEAWLELLGIDLKNYSAQEFKNASKVWADYTDRFRQAVNEFRYLPKKMTTKIYYRGVVSHENSLHDGIKAIKNAKTGDIIIPDTGFSYASLKKSEAASFALLDTEFTGNKILMKIVAPPGTKVSSNPFHLKEVIFPPNSQYKLTAKTEKDGVIFAELEYIVPK